MSSTSRKSWPRPKVGDRFGEWTVLETGLRLPYTWRTVCACRVRCACGTEKLVWNANLVMRRSPRCQRCAYRKHGRMVRVDGQRANVSDTARRLGLDPGLVIGRLHSGWTLAQALGRKARPPARPVGRAVVKYVTSDGLPAWRVAASAGVSRQLLSLRLKRGWPVDEAVAVPPHGERRTTA